MEWVLLKDEIVGIKFEKYFFILEGQEGRPWIMNIIFWTTLIGFMLVCFLPVRILLSEVIENEEILSWLKEIPSLVVISIVVYFETIKVKIVQELEKKCILEVQNSSDN